MGACGSRAQYEEAPPSDQWDKSHQSGCVYRVELRGLSVYTSKESKPIAGFDSFGTGAFDTAPILVPLEEARAGTRIVTPL